MASPLPLKVIPPSAPHTHTVVFLHGRGDNTTNFVAALGRFRDSNGRTLADSFPSFRWVFPQAPTRQCLAVPERWPQWFDVWDPRDFAEREELQLEGLREVVPQIRDLLANEAATLDGRWDKVIIAGISMGGATSVHTLFNLEVPTPEGRLGAFLGFSARCPFAGRGLEGMRQVLGLSHVPDDNIVLANTPILLEHCVDDPLVRIQNGRGLRDVLTSFGAKVTWKEYPDGGHWFNSPSGADDVVAFLQKVLQQS
ncbi:hypothetical protein G3M48_005652 [Beauveria asiatica]|uniref:Phospholipase/carboxylesterase/thioesterase domain-containing protein n=1 Tax=Beauveria asiatica TaxID=1069075 RepID=A0AAW0RR45_9HYPO